MSETTTFSATGRRKTANAHAWITPGKGKIKVNQSIFEDYFPTVSQQNAVLEPLQIANQSNKFDITITTKGGGITGQIGAIKLAVARALIQFDPELRPALKEAGLLRRDPRMKERKKYGQPGARKNFQFSKR